MVVVTNMSYGCGALHNHIDFSVVYCISLQDFSIVLTCTRYNSFLSLDLLLQRDLEGADRLSGDQIVVLGGGRWSSWAIAICIPRFPRQADRRNVNVQFDFPICF